MTTAPADTVSGTEELLSIRDLSVVFRIRGRGDGFALRAVDGVSFDIGVGETLGIAGESGSGKTTLALSVIGHHRIQSGSIRLQGRDIANLKGRRELQEMRSQIQFIFQDPNTTLNPRHRVWDIVSEPLLVHGIERDKERRRERAVELLELCGLGQATADRFPGEFSGGQRQRIGVARALALDPALIIADEPTSALDVSVQAQIINLLRDIQEETQVSFLFISHNLAVLRQVSDRLGIMQRGRLVEIGSCELVFNDPQDPYTRELLASVPSIRRPVRAGVPDHAATAQSNEKRDGDSS